MYGYWILNVALGPVETTIATIRKKDVYFVNSSDTVSVVIHWNITENRNITQYIVVIHPLAPPCNDSDGVSGGKCVINEGDDGFSSRELILQLNLGVKYKVIARSVNCGTQAGNDSDPVSILLHGV